jgi:hypothetical protein
MEKTEVVFYRVGDTFPHEYPTREGSIMELQDPSDLVIYIQYPGLTREEKQAFKKSFKKYSFFEAPGDVPVAFFTFDFPKPFGMVEVNFNAKLVSLEILERFMSEENGMKKNALTFFLLDGDILKGIKRYGLHPGAVEAFHATIRKQLAAGYSNGDFNEALARLSFRFSVPELFREGRVFRSKPK